MDARLASYLARLPQSSATSAQPSPVFATQATELARHGIALIGAHSLETGMVIAGWMFIGSAALNGRLEQGWLAAWALCLASCVPLRGWSRWFEGRLSVGLGGWLRERLLAGAMAVEPDFIRRKGTGEWLSEVLELEQIERLGTAAGIAAVLASLELLAALIVLAWGGAASAQIVVLLAWLGLASILLVQHTRQRMRYTEHRFAMTARLVENMIAHRTRAAQEPLSRRHRADDLDHERHIELSQGLDHSMARIDALLPRAYVITALVALAPTLIGSDVAATELAITVAGILLAAAAFERFAFGFAGASAAWVAWRRLRCLFDAARKSAAHSKASGIATAVSGALIARDVTFTHQGRIEPTLRKCNLTVRRGDLVLLEGASGSGKSTLATVLAGLRKPTGGVILAGGLDLHTLGSAWSRRVVLAPQYHENHILCAPLHFNLLLGRPLPHSRQDLQQARAICEELGLGPLLQRMPSGLDQVVGETGWQLSQGERSRVFLARALLQNADAIVLDESFAALDPENLARCMECVQRRAKAAVVIAHP